MGFRAKMIILGCFGGTTFEGHPPYPCASQEPATPPQTSGTGGTRCHIGVWMLKGMAVSKASVPQVTSGMCLGGETSSLSHRIHNVWYILPYIYHTKSTTSIGYHLGGGNSNIFVISTIWRACFSNGVAQPPARCLFDKRKTWYTNIAGWNIPISPFSLGNTSSKGPFFSAYVSLPECTVRMVLQQKAVGFFRSIKTIIEICFPFPWGCFLVFGWCLPHGKLKRFRPENERLLVISIWVFGGNTPKVWLKRNNGILDVFEANS